MPVPCKVSGWSCICVLWDIYFASFYDLNIWFWNRSDSVVLFCFSCYCIWIWFWDKLRKVYMTTRDIQLIMCVFKLKYKTRTKRLIIYVYKKIILRKNLQQWWSTTLSIPIKQTTTSNIKSLNIKKRTMTYDVENLGPVLEQTPTCDGC